MPRSSNAVGARLILTSLTDMIYIFWYCCCCCFVYNIMRDVDVCIVSPGVY